MAVDMFLDLGAKIKGESIDAAYKDKIEILGYQWGLDNTGSFHSGSGGGSSKVSIHDITVNKYVDLASANIMQYCADGTHFDTASIYVRKAGGTAMVYLKIDLKKVLISHYHLGASSGQDRLTESVALNFAEVKVEYTPQGDKGSKGTSQYFSWNIPKGTKD
jgi:type VI secretion system secreted protein Hcp